MSKRKTMPRSITCKGSLKASAQSSSTRLLSELLASIGSMWSPCRRGEEYISRLALGAEQRAEPALVRLPHGCRLAMLALSQGRSMRVGAGFIAR